MNEQERQKFLRDRKKFPWLHADASPVPDGMRPKRCVTYGCGKPDCLSCYEPELTKTARNEP